ncbi:hypothetical protein [Oleiphilus messinensis]|nr:hypothetical protein [Oleiphilus messinensis]
MKKEESKYDFIYEGLIGLAGLVYALYGLLLMELPLPVLRDGEQVIVRLVGFELFVAITGLLIYAIGLLIYAINGYRGARRSMLSLTIIVIMGLIVFASAVALHLK